ncbi:hypothetical protein PVK06_028353 [Gossypium arboreum]|uniref:CCHC-type domain-containing protein n=1 Tax=Gossypium arboreum TaxID=29729 RepID=A0ABR0P3W4_GOSAR|nr:hypothetical protein PVK06_028353 [Gossypium arboreum]
MRSCNCILLESSSESHDVCRPSVQNRIHVQRRHVFPPIPDERKWPSVSLAPFKLLPDRELRRKPKRQPFSTRIRNNMNIRERTNQQRLCRWCRNPGHITRSCPNRNS